MADVLHTNSVQLLATLEILTVEHCWTDVSSSSSRTKFRLHQHQLLHAQADLYDAQASASRLPSVI